MKTIRVSFCRLVVLSATALAAAPAGHAQDLSQEAESAVEVPQSIRRPVVRARPTIAGPHIRAPNAEEPGVMVIEGRLALVSDGMIHIAVPIPEELRRQASRTRQVPLSSLPTHFDQKAYYSAATLGRRVRDLMRKPVRARLKVNERGYLFLLSIEPLERPRR